MLLKKTPVRQRIVVSARLLGFGYQRLMPSFAGVRFEMSNDGWHSFVALNDESASVDASFDFYAGMEQYACRGQLLCGGAVFAWYCRRDAFAHQRGKTTS